VTPLSPANAKRVAILFSAKEAAKASKLIEQECSENLDRSPELLERIQTAVIKVSNGTMERLEWAIAMAQTDWRDLLVEAGFAHDIELHKAWWPSENAS